MAKLTDFQLLVLEKEEIDCSDVEDLLGDFVDSDLPTTLRGRVDSHIKCCTYCQEIEESYRFTIDLAHELGENPPPVPTDVRNRLRKALNEKLGMNIPLVDDTP